MRRTSMSIVAGLATAVLLVPTVPAQAAVKAKDAPSQADLTQAFPELAGGQFATDTTKAVGVPGKTCGQNGTAKAKSAYSVSGVSAEGQPVVAAGVGELKSSATTVKYFKAYKKFVKSCASYTDPTTGATVTMEMGKAPKLGQESLMITQQIAIAGVTSYTATVLVRHKKRMGSVLVIDDAPIATSGLNKLAKVTAKKMK
jgi:hypothetical protein